MVSDTAPYDAWVFLFFYQRVADDARGIADIEQEFISQNGQFVLHDSEGFEEGDADGIDIVKRFVKRHSDQQQIQDRLHAVW